MYMYNVDRHKQKNLEYCINQIPRKKAILYNMMDKAQTSWDNYKMSNDDMIDYKKMKLIITCIE